VIFGLKINHLATLSRSRKLEITQRSFYWLQPSRSEPLAQDNELAIVKILNFFLKNLGGANEVPDE
jgi:hypothetical protein